MPVRTVTQWPKPLPAKTVAKGIARRTWRKALLMAMFYVGFYFLLQAKLGSYYNFALGYALATAILWPVLVMSPTIWLYILAKRHGVPFRILWEVVVKYEMTPASAFVNQRAWMVRHIEGMRGQQSDEPDAIPD